MDRYHFLSSIHPISKQEYDELLVNLHVKSFRKGEPIISSGQVQRQIYFIKRGVQMCHFDQGDKTHVIAFTYPPNLCALPDSFSEQKPSKYHFTCITDSEMEYLVYDDLQRVYEKYKNIETLFRKINEKLPSGLLNLHLEFRTMTIEERFTTFCRRSPHLLQHVPHKYIASYLGIDATNFSKLFNSVKI
ncbi:MAG: cyclic nucleotide-binding domain-containing protein [Chryseolinea sp.]